MKATTAIVTVAFTCVNQFVTLGFIYTCGIYQIVFLQTYSEEVTFTSWVMSLQLGMLCLAGMLLFYS